MIIIDKDTKEGKKQIKILKSYVDLVNKGLEGIKSRDTKNIKVELTNLDKTGQIDVHVQWDHIAEYKVEIGGR